tara:strand:+ start:1991 stop:2311 length:321 start_codon:yes stop_codon:yes gene_type:complete
MLIKVCILAETKTHYIVNKFEEPIRTDIEWNGIKDSSMSIMGESEKAYLFIISKLVRKGTSMSFERTYREQWIPKSVWDNDKNFDTYLLGGDRGVEVTTFKPPYFL